MAKLRLVAVVPSDVIPQMCEELNLTKLVGKIVLTLLAVGMLLFNSACAIGRYSPSEPAVKPAISTSKEQDFLFFSYITLSGDQEQVDPRKLPSVSRRVKGLLEQYSKFKTAVPTLSAPARGTYVTFYQTTRPDPWSIWCTVNLWTLFVIPCVFETAHETHFDVYVNNVLTRRYQYDLHWEAVQWIGLVPFFWVNFFLTDHDDAFSANASQFITDAKQDGLL